MNRLYRSGDTRDFQKVDDYYCLFGPFVTNAFDSSMFAGPVASHNAG